MKFHTKLPQTHKIYGNTVVGTKGQIVIPATARKDFRIKPGDSFVVMGTKGMALGLFRARELSKMIRISMKKIENLAEGEFKNELKKGIRKLLSSIPKK